MKIYHTETQEDYDALMVELEGDGVTWRFGALPTKENNWKARLENMCVRVSHQVAEYGSIDTYLKIYPDVPIAKYKAKADDKMKFTKENVEKAIDDYFWEADFESCGSLLTAVYNLDDTPKKVGVPNDVAEWIEWNKRMGTRLKNMLKCYGDFYDGYSEGSKAVQWYVDNPYKFIRAYEDGYTIEPEQLYYIPLPHLELSGGIRQVLSKQDTYFVSRPNENLKQRFTKEEIAQVPEIYKPYAKLVEEGAE